MFSSSILPAFGMGNYVIVLSPHGLKGGVLLNIPTAPCQRQGIALTYAYTYFTTNYRNATKPTVITVTRVNRLFLCRRWHSHLRTLCGRE